MGRHRGAAARRVAGRWAALPLILVLSLAACTSTAKTTAPPATPTPSSTGATLASDQVEYMSSYTFSGASTASSSYVELRTSEEALGSCAQSASQGNDLVTAGTFHVPTPPYNAYPQIAVELTGLTAPGTFTSKIGGTITLAAGGVAYSVTASGATVSLMLGANGDGSFTFSGAEPPTGSATALSGTVSWTCTGATGD